MPGTSGDHGSRRSRPPTTPESQESHLVSLAFSLVEKRLRNGTATSQETTHFLKLGSSREKLEQQRLNYENALLGVKKEALESAARMESLYADAIKAMRNYQGQAPEEPEDEIQDEYR